MTNQTSLLAPLLVALAATSSCKAVSAFFSGDPQEVSYSSRAEENMRKGQEQLDARNFVEAAKYFDHVRVKFPYLDLAKEAELKLADTDFEREKFAEARERYTSFVRLHPTHPKVDYAAFRAALTHFKDMPTDLFIFPPASEKDQIEIKATLDAMAEFLHTYPESTHAAEAQKALLDAKRRLADHELYVADFYARRGYYKAVVGRLQVIDTRYTGAYPERVAFGLYDAYLKLEQRDAARRALERYLERTPEDPGAPRARELLARLAAMPPAPVPAAAPDAGS